MYARFVLLFMLCMSRHTCGAAATYAYDYDLNCNRAYQAVMALRIPEARAYIIKEITANPYNLMITYVSDYEDCLTLLLNCDKTDYMRRVDDFDTRLALLQKGDRASPWYRLCLSGLYLHWAIVHTRFGEQYKAALKFRKAFSLLKENRELFPTFEYNNVFSGLQEAVIGSLPGNYKWLASLFGFRGNLKQGVDKLSRFMDNHDREQPLYCETALYYAYTRFYLAYDQAGVWSFLNSARFPTSGNLMNTFVKSGIAIDYHKADAAIDVLKAAGADAAFNNYPILNFQLAIALLGRTDPSCVDYFHKYLDTNKSDLYIKEAWQKMAWSWYIAGDMKQAEQCRAHISGSGSNRLDADKQAERFAGSTTWPVKDILRARLLIDGGYPARGLAVLASVAPSSLPGPADKAEYYFRYARAYDELGDNKKALEQYHLAITTGQGRHEQFAARAALQVGLIHERSGAKAEALESFHQCLDMPSHDFQNSIDQLAKAGINRIEGR